MTENEYISALRAQRPQGSKASRKVLSLASLAVRDFPQSAKLWFLRGQLIDMAPEDYIFSKLDATCSFAEAIRLDPSLAKAHEQLRRGREATENASEPDGQPDLKPGKQRGEQ